MSIQKGLDIVFWGLFVFWGYLSHSLACVRGAVFPLRGYTRRALETSPDNPHEPQRITESNRHRIRAPTGAHTSGNRTHRREQHEHTSRPG